MKTMFRTFLSLGILAMLAGPAMAQGRGFGRGGGGLAMLLGNASVQKELKLDDQQIEKAKELGEKAREKMQELRESLQGLEGEERMTKMREHMKEMNESTVKTAGAFLKPEQITRLKQISYQQQGLMAFSDPEVAKKLNLTESQKSDIQAIAQETREKQPSREDFQDDREAAMKKMQELNKEALGKVASKLNDEQQKTWKELIGAAVHHRLRAPSPITEMHHRLAQPVPSRNGWARSDPDEISDMRFRDLARFGFESPDSRPTVTLRNTRIPEFSSSIQEFDPMKTTLTAFLSLSLVALLTSPAAAQGRGGGFRGSVVFLLGNESVQKELKLDDSQLEKTKALAEKMAEEAREKREGLQDLSPEERMTKMMEINREITASVYKSLGEFFKPEQVTRLKQIAHQQGGAQALTEPEVAKKLNLTDDQKKEIQTIVTESRTAMREIFQDTQDQEERMQKMTELRKKTLEKALAKLNDEQQKGWKEMLGAHFEIKIEQN